ncbi:zincin [Thozetella sp. PMI_491]|nr:zincin [Thozetella sp. PMI_491]
MSSNGHAGLPQLPLTFTLTADSITRESERICDTTKALLDHLVATVPPEAATFENVLCPLAEDEDARNLVSDVLSLYHHVSPNLEIRQASESASKKREQFLIGCRAREDVFRLVDAVFHKKEPLDPESQKLLIEWHRKYFRNGIGLESQEQKDELKAINVRLSSITTEFGRNLDEDAGPIGQFTREQLAGMPQARLDELESNSHMDPGAEKSAGKISIAMKGQIVFELLRCVDDPQIRKEVSRLRYQTGLKNKQLFEEGVSLRNKAARILGYKSYADFQLELKMAKSSVAVMDFLNDIRDRAIPHRDRELDELLKFKLADLSKRGLPSENDIYAWDTMYYRERFQTETESVDQQKIAEYFPVQPTLIAMLDLFGDLFGFVFSEVKEEDRRSLSPTGQAADLTWHEDVIIYTVWNTPDSEFIDQNGSNFVGYLYLDLYHRPGKFGGFMCYPIQFGFTRPGSRHYPSTLLLTSYSSPTKETPTLLRHDEVVVLFHELGHGIHDLTGRSRYTRFHGAQTVGDFNEAPSQMLENWCWSKVGLQKFSSHYQSGEQLPDSVIDSLLRTKTRGTMQLMAILKMSLFDMDVHSCGDEETTDVEAVYGKYRELSGAKDPEDNRHAYTTYRHLFHGTDSGAGMYNYLWAKAHAMDMFDTAFKQNPLDGQAGRRYRRMVLEKGATQDEMKTLKDFLGRDPRPEAFLADLGLI